MVANAVSNSFAVTFTTASGKLSHMDIIEIIATLVTLAALLSYINHRFLKLPSSIGLMLLALVGCVVLIILQKFGL